LEDDPFLLGVWPIFRCELLVLGKVALSTCDMAVTIKINTSQRNPPEHASCSKGMDFSPGIRNMRSLKQFRVFDQTPQIQHVFKLIKENKRK